MKRVFWDESYAINGAIYEVYNVLGHGFLEKVYQEALEREFAERNIPYKREMAMHVVYKGKELNQVYYADFVCYDKIIVELKAVDKLTGAHRSQVINYLKATGTELGILVNFGGERLEIERLFNPNYKE